MAVGLSSSLYSIHMHMGGSSTLHGPAVKYDCKTVGIRMHFGGRGFTYWDQTARCLVPRLRVLGVTNVPWDHLSGPQTYINDVECNK